MDIFLTYLKVFAVGGGICIIGQLLINFTKMTSSRILVIFLLSGIIMEAVGIFDYLKDFASAGITIPIIGFGANLAKGAIEGAKSAGFLGAIAGGLRATSVGVSGAIFFGFIISLIAKSKTKNKYK